MIRSFILITVILWSPLITARTSDIFVCHPWVSITSGAPCGAYCARDWIWNDGHKKWEKRVDGEFTSNHPEILMIPSQPLVVHNIGDLILPDSIKFIEGESKQTHQWNSPVKLIETQEWYSYSGRDANLEIEIDGNYPFSVYLLERNRGIPARITNILKTSCAAPNWRH